MQRLRVIFMVSLLLLAQRSFAYSSNWLGIQGGLSLANTSTLPPGGTSQNPRPVAMAGLFFDDGLSDALFFRFEVNYRPGGFVWSLNGANTVYPYDVVEFPVLIVIKFGSSHFSPIIFTGPAPSFAVNRYSGTSPFDIVFHLGGGAEWDITKGLRFYFTARLAAGLFDVVGNSGLGTVQNESFLFLSGIEIKF